MSSRQQRIVRIGVVCAVLANSAVARSQGRFVTVTREAVAGVPGLEIVMVRDSAVNACYALFVTRPTPLVRTPAQVQPTSVEAAAVQRDERLSELSTEFENALRTAVPGTLGPDSLKYQWEGQKAQSEFEHVLRETELARLEAWLRQIAGAPKLAVAGPGPCSTPASPSKQDER